MASGYIIKKVRGGVKIFPALTIGNELITFGIGNATFTLDPAQYLPKELQVVINDDSVGNFEVLEAMNPNGSFVISASGYTTKSKDIGGGNIVSYKSLNNAKVENKEGRYECSGVMNATAIVEADKIMW